MKMNDDFIYEVLPEVRREFAQSLYAKISVDTNRRSQTGRNPIRVFPRKLQVALLILGVLLLVAWSQLRLWIRYVPIGNLWLVEFSLTQSAAAGQSTVNIPTPGQLPTEIIDGETVILLPGFQYLSPGWVPAGFSPIQVPVSSYSYEESIGMWSNQAQETIRLFVVPAVGGAHPYAPSGMYKEVHVKGRPAVLVYGRFAPNPPDNPQLERKWDRSLGLQLSWNIEESVYTLETLGTYVSEEDLIRMAESMKTVDSLPSSTP
jgi:hypothetical protein